VAGVGQVAKVTCGKKQVVGCRVEGAESWELGAGTAQVNSVSE
jgi:hypothetical protein